MSTRGTELVARAKPDGGAVIEITVSGTGLFNYDRMILAIAECRRLDEVKDIRDRAVALQAYARQARNVEAEREVTRIRLRAEYRAGQLLKAMEKATGGDAQRTRFHKGTESPPKLADLGITKKQSFVWQQLADIPEEAFHDYLSSEEKLNAYGVVRSFANIAASVGRAQSGRWWEPEEVRWEHHLPEVVREELRPYKTLRVHFAAHEDMEAFGRLVGQRITLSTKSVWYPKADVISMVNERYAEPEPEAVAER